jgi:hypothetical protein
VGLLAEPDRLRALAAVFLGAEDLPEVAERAGLEPRAAVRALSRLVAGGLLEGEVGKGYRVRAEVLRAAAVPPAGAGADAGTAGPAAVAGTPVPAPVAGTPGPAGGAGTPVPAGGAGTAGPVAESPGGGGYPSGERQRPGSSTAPGSRDDAVLRRFIHNGRLLAMPAARGKRLVVLDYLAGLFEPGRRYPEPEVNELLARFHPDYALLRRYLVDDGFLDRADEAAPGGSRTVKVYWRSGGTIELD